MGVELVDDTTEQLRAIARVLVLTAGYISTQNKDLLLAWDGGLMTWAEIYKQLQAALELECLEQVKPWG